MGLKIAIAVHGRFHAFDVARELLRRGHDVTLFTNYPRFAVKPFGVPKAKVQSLWVHGVLSRLTWRLRQKGLGPYPERWLHRFFGGWAASRIAREDWDVALCWSGVGEEAFQALKGSRTLRVCQRGSAHIRAQARLLAEEEARTGRGQLRPSLWIIAREEREYALADEVLVPSSFTRDTFLAEGFSSHRISMVPLATRVEAFRPSAETVEARCARILSGEPLRALNVGTFSFRKGMWDMAKVVQQLGPDGFRFRFVGPVAPEAAALVSELRPLCTFVPKQPEGRLPACYAWGDLFLLPSIEDGYQLVLPQAVAAGLPLLTTPNGAGADLVRDGETGWVLPIRDPEAFSERLRWCDAHREELAAMARRVYEAFQPRDWAQVAADLEALWTTRLKGRPL